MTTEETYPPRSLFVGEENCLSSVDVFAVACMAACGTSVHEIKETFMLTRKEVHLFTDSRASMLGDSWAEHIITYYMEACTKEEDPEKAINRFNNAVKMILHWYDCCSTMLTMYAGLEPDQPLPDLASFASTLLICSKTGIVSQLLNEEVADQVIDAAKKFSVACEYLEHLIQQGSQDDTAIVGQLKAVFSMEPV